jgi:hypothetical protein
MIDVRPGVNELELLVVLDRLKQDQVHWATVQPGNDCVWVARGSASVPINEYYIFRQGRLVDIQID